MRGDGANGPRPAALFDRRPAEIRALAPYLGADDTVILKEIGYSDAEIDALAEQRVLVSQRPQAPFPFWNVNTARNDRN